MMSDMNADCRDCVTVRKVTADDAGAITSIYNEYVLNTTVSFETEALTVEAMAERIGSIAERFPYYVAEVGGKVVGYCYAHEWKERRAYSRTLESTVYVDSAYKHHHVGVKLMAILVEECRKHGCHALVACITGENGASIAFHERLGFERVSCFKEVGYKFGRYLDVVDYELAL